MLEHLNVLHTLFLTLTNKEQGRHSNLDFTDEEIKSPEKLSDLT